MKDRFVITSDYNEYLIGFSSNYHINHLTPKTISAQTKRPELYQHITPGDRWITKIIDQHFEVAETVIHYNKMEVVVVDITKN